MNQRCVALPFNGIRNHLYLDRICFSFIMKKKIIDNPLNGNDRLFTSPPHKVSAINGIPKPEKPSIASRLQIAQNGANSVPIPSSNKFLQCHFH